MITKMTHYSFILMKGDTTEFLESLTGLGIMDITRATKAMDAQSEALAERIESLKEKISLIEKGSDQHMAELQTQKADIERTIKEIRPWGDFELAKLKAIAPQVRFYCVAASKFEESGWQEQCALEVVEREAGNVWFVVLDGTEISAKELPAPACSISEAAAKLDAKEEEIAAYAAVLEARKDEIPGLQEQIAQATAELELYLAASSAESAAEGTLAVFQGFAPSTEDAPLKAELDKLPVYWTARPATKEDNPPIKLRNNWFARQFETLTGMYGMPVYDEWDPTPILAPFFLLFFSMCMGDAGYGLLLIAIAYALKACKGEGPMGLAKHWRLIRTLGIGTFVIGVLLGTFFGISLADAAWVPAGMKKILLTGNVGSFPLQMVLALGIGVFHISLAMVVKSMLYTKRFGFKETISSWGWTLLIVGGILAFVICAIAQLPAELTKWIIIGIAAVSALGIFIFNKPGRNPLINIGAGLWDTYQMATGILGDVLSYIRLYALGLAGGMLGSAFNTLGGMVLGSNPTFQWIFFAIIVVAGHALNLAMSCLGAFVHPLRLSFVEYFKNSGYEGMGVKYNPLTKATKE